MRETDPGDDLLRTEADAREELHKDHDSRLWPGMPDYNFISLKGEAHFAKQNKLYVDLTPRRGGDNGIDFEVPLRYTVDVKTFRKPHNLIVEQGKIRADIYVLIAYDENTKSCRSIGWQWGHVLAKAPVKDFGYGVMNHYIAAEQLRPMRELEGRIMHLQ